MSASTNQPFNSAFADMNTRVPSYEAKPGETYMNPRQKAHLKQILETERSYWVNIQKRIISEFLQKKEGRSPADAADIANQEVEVRSVVRGREHRLIKKIDTALNRLDTEGSRYGFCDICDSQIGIARLEVRPTANLCFDCKTLDEIREKQSGHT